MNHMEAGGLGLAWCSLLAEHSSGLQTFGHLCKTYVCLTGKEFDRAGTSVNIEQK